MLEEVGVVPDGNGDYVNAEIEIIDRVNEDKSEWSKLVSEKNYQLTISTLYKLHKELLRRLHLFATGIDSIMSQRNASN